MSKALAETERRVESLHEAVEGLPSSRERVFKVPSTEWIKERLLALQDLFEERTEKSALLLREILGPITLTPVAGEVEKPFYRAETALEALALVDSSFAEPPVEGGSSGLR